MAHCIELIPFPEEQNYFGLTKNYIYFFSETHMKIESKNNYFRTSKRKIYILTMDIKFNQFQMPDLSHTP